MNKKRDDESVNLGLLSRRTALQLAAAGASSLAANMSVVDVLGGEAMADQVRRSGKRVILLWLAGGASQLETWDPKPGRATGGPFAKIRTNLPGVEISELMPKMSTRLGETAIIRSLNTKIADHGTAYELMDTGRVAEPSLKFPHLGALIARELGWLDSQVPDYVTMYTSTEGRREGSAGFLGGRYNPMFLTDSMIPPDIRRLESISDVDHHERSELRRRISDSFTKRFDHPVFDGHNAAYDRVRGLMSSDHLFNIDLEPQSVRDLYGPTQFGQQCLIARRLAEAGVPFVKVARAWWDSHGQNFETHQELCADLDHCMSALLDDLKSRGMLEDTLVITLGEFGRTPKINGSLGRDHFASAWSCTLSGCGIRGGTVYGKTDDDGQTVVDGEMNAGDLFATIFAALGIDPAKEYMVGSRPVPIADFDSTPCREVLA
ncbi:MAG: DUF1501 domain-containing protein [Planctomycetales bacterium]|nr:DUF1501 domain-containing protein [Planctomycetales bacterium]